MINSIGIIESKGLVALIEAADVILKNSPIKILGVKKLENGIVSLSVFGESEYVKSAVESGTDAGRRVGEIYAYSVVDDPNEELLNILNDFFDLDEEEFSKPKNKISKTDSKEEKKKITRKEIAPTFKQSKVKFNTAKPVEKADSKRNKTFNDQALPIIQNETVSRLKTQPMEDLKAEKTMSTIERLRKEALGLSAEVKENETALTPEKKIERIGATSTSSKVDFEVIKEMNVHKLRNYARGFENFPIKGRQISRANRDKLVDLFKTIS